MSLSLKFLLKLVFLLLIVVHEKFNTKYKFD